MEVSDAALDTVSSTRGTPGDDASLSFEIITTGVATDDPRSPSSASRLVDGDDEEEDGDDESGNTTHESHGRATRKRQHGYFPWYTHMIGYQVHQPVHTFSQECNRLNLKDHEHYYR